MRNYIIGFLSVVFFISCIGGKSVPVQYYTLNLEGEGQASLNVREIRAGAQIHQRMNLKKGSHLELREFERWQDSPHRLIESELKNHFPLGVNELRGELNEFVFDQESMESRISIDFLFETKDKQRFFRIKSVQAIRALDGDSLAQSMSLAVQDIFKQLDKNLQTNK
ncbi:hypothetical protein PQO03_09085 [Lentisphaera profundi]|uniref:ABC-type transport auxiliary lipoprotein component domain-containing protein n=1 Tax=Lentisphaera profundi TaxID=1658616 RepID=A0ABY7VQ78_9BACT|nr:hypothetical protein [Lentisphaera profundi]WDE95869.1 hypothetical protein PQO03_09085 [Lentisphaera profundi]